MAAVYPSAGATHCKHKEKHIEIQDQIQTVTPFWQLRFIFISFFTFPEVAGTLLTIGNADLNSPSQKRDRHSEEDSDCVLSVCLTLSRSSELMNSKPEELDLEWWILGGSIEQMYLDPISYKLQKLVNS